MKQVIPFKKDIIFKTKISEITSISLEHTLEVDEDIISGDFIVSGDYKMTDASINREEFSHKLPFDIALDSRYDTSNVKLEIADFYYEIINSDVLRVNIEVKIDGLEDKPFKEIENTEIINLEEERNDTTIDELSATIDDLKRELDEKNANLFNLERYIEEQKESEKEERKVIVNNLNQNIETSTINEIPIMKAEENKVNTTEIKSLFSNISEEETFSTYHVYIMREEDTIESVMTKYTINKEILMKYNDLENVSLGDKIIIPAIISE